MAHLARLGDLVEFLSGFAFKSELFNSDKLGMPLIRIRDVVPGKSETYYSGEYENRYLILDGEYLIGMDGEFNLAQWRGGPALLNQRVCKVDQIDDELDIDYLARFLPLALKAIEASTPFATVKHLSVKSLREIRIPVPPLADQRRIAQIVEHADALRAKRLEALAHLSVLTRAVFLEMFGDPVTNPRGWPIVNLLELGTLDRGVSKHRPRNDPALLGGRHPLVQTGEVANSGGYIRSFTQTYSDLGLAQSKSWPTGTLCITIAANIAKTGILTFEACFPDSVVGFRSDPSTTQYVRVWLGFLQATLERAAPQSAQKNINLAILRNLPVPRPPLHSIQQFAERVERLEGAKLLGSAQASRLNDLFTSLQERVFAGNL